MDNKTRVAVAQVSSVLGAVNTNIERALAVLDEAAVAGHDLVVFAECTLSGYLFEDESQVRSAALSLGDHRLTVLTDACRQTGMHAVVGLLELDGDDVYNSAAVLGPAGLLGVYRKSHLPFLGADRFVSPGRGESPRVIRTPVGNIGVMICFDLRFPESARTLALQGADIIVMPTAWPQSATFLSDHMTRVRAVENFVYLAVADRADHEQGVTYLGRSQVVAPNGDVLVDGGTEEGLFGVEIDLAAARVKRIVNISGEYELDVFGQRKPEQYGSITSRPTPNLDVVSCRMRRGRTSNEGEGSTCVDRNSSPRRRDRRLPRMPRSSARCPRARSGTRTRSACLICCRQNGAGR